MRGGVCRRWALGASALDDTRSFDIEWDFESEGARFFNVFFRKGDYGEGHEQASLFEEESGFPITRGFELQNSSAECTWTNQADIRCVAESDSVFEVGFDETSDLRGLWGEEGDRVYVDIRLCRAHVDIDDFIDEDGEPIDEDEREDDIEDLEDMLICNRYELGTIELH